MRVNVIARRAAGYDAAIFRSDRRDGQRLFSRRGRLQFVHLAAGLTDLLRRGLAELVSLHLEGGLQLAAGKNFHRRAHTGQTTGIDVVQSDAVLAFNGLITSLHSPFAFSKSRNWISVFLPNPIYSFPPLQRVRECFLWTLPVCSSLSHFYDSPRKLPPAPFSCYLLSVVSFLGSTHTH